MSIEHIVVHKGSGYHSAFPDIARLNNGDLVVVFREAPFRDWRDHHHLHLDDRSQSVLLRSTDDGMTWDPDSRVVISATNGTRDLSNLAITQMSSGDLVVVNHRWFVRLTEAQAAALGDQRWVRTGERPFPIEAFDSLYLLRSADGGYTWSEPQPATTGPLAYRTHIGMTGIIEMPDGSWLLPFNGFCAGEEMDRVHVARSFDGGHGWEQPSVVAYDPEGRTDFSEPSVLLLPSGKMLAVMRTGEGAKQHLYQAFSTDGGWIWRGLKRTPMWGQPPHLLRLASGRILCAYGYRREPWGIRAVLSEDEGETWEIALEIVIRDDGLHFDLGYPASVQLQDGRILTTYYFHGQDGIRYIAGSIYTEEEAYR